MPVGSQNKSFEEVSENCFIEYNAHWPNLGGVDCRRVSSVSLLSILNNTSERDWNENKANQIYFPSDLAFKVHNILFIALLLGPKAKPVLTKQPCCIQTKI